MGKFDILPPWAIVIAKDFRYHTRQEALAFQKADRHTWPAAASG
ncbi:hypothetical protein [Leminorella grimontii]|nr:hypothetical protein [Leminorella grimontii]